MSDLHKCPKNGCEVQLPRHLLACRPHWYEVPSELRNAVNMTWRNFHNDPNSYLAARAAAVEAINR